MPFTLYVDKTKLDSPVEAQHSITFLSPDKDLIIDSAVTVKGQKSTLIIIAKNIHITAKGSISSEGLVILQAKNAINYYERNIHAAQLQLNSENNLIQNNDSMTNLNAVVAPIVLSQRNVETKLVLDMSSGDQSGQTSAQAQNGGPQTQVKQQPTQESPKNSRVYSPIMSTPLGPTPIASPKGYNSDSDSDGEKQIRETKFDAALVKSKINRALENTKVKRRHSC